MEYLNSFNRVLDIVEGDGGHFKLSDAQIEEVRKVMERCYKQGFKEGTGRLREEELDVDKAIKLQRVMNRFGAKK